MTSFLPLIRAEWRLLLFGFVMTFGSSLGQTYFISLFGGEIRADLSLSHSEFGGIYSAATLFSAVVMLWSGSLIDKMDLRRFSYIITIGLVAGCVVLAASTNMFMLFMGIFMLRHLGQGLMYMTSTTTMVRYLDENKGKANAIGGLGYSVSEAILPTLVILVLAWLSWRMSWLFWSGLLLLLLPAMIYFLLRNHDQRHQQYLESVAAEQNAPEQHRKYRRRQWTRAEVIRDPQFYLFLPAIMAQPILFTGFMFHQVPLVEAKGWSMAMWGSLYVLYAFTTFVMKLVAGALTDRFGAVLLIPLMSLPLALGLFILGSSDHVVAAVVFMVLLGIAAGCYTTIIAPFFSEKYGNRHLGAIKSLSTSVMVFASAIAPVILGWGMDAGVSLDTMAHISVVYILLSSGLAWYASRLHYAQLAAVEA